MPKDVAVFDEVTLAQLVARSPDFGYEVANPVTGLAHGFPAGGGFLELAIEEVDGFLQEGNGVLLWKRGTSECLFAYQASGRPRLSLGPLSLEERDALLRALLEQGFRVRDPDR